MSTFHSFQEARFENERGIDLCEFGVIKFCEFVTMDSPQNHIWGPELWFLLHSSAERFGRPLSKRLPDDEKRIWTSLLRSLQYSLPCPLCKKHYAAYLTKHPITLTREGIRTWLWNLHNEVNTRNNKPIMGLEELIELYDRPFQFTKHFPIVVKQMRMALGLGWSTREDMLRTIRFFDELVHYYDFF